MIAHLLGDFVFQSNSLIKEKYKSWHGTLKHGIIIGLFTMIALFPYLGSAKAWIVIATIAVAHFSQDVLKVAYDKRYNKKKSATPFFVDQASHLTLIFLLGRGFTELTPIQMPSWLEWIYFSNTVMALFAFMILISYVVDIVVYQFKVKKKNGLKYHPDYIGMLQRILAFNVFYLFFFILYHFSTN